MKLKFILPIFIFAFFLIPSYTFAQTKTIQSASETDYPPYCITKEDGTADGFSVQLLRETLKVMGHDVNFKVDTWDVVKNDLVTGNVQVLPLVGRTPERETLFDFTFPYITLRGTVFRRSSDAWITSINDLRNKEIIVMKGDNAEEYLRRINITDNIILVKTFTEAMLLLESGKHDAVVAQRLMGVQLLDSLKIDTIESTGELLEGFTQDFSFAVREGDGDLLADLNEGLSIVMANGTYDQLHRKWFSLLRSEEVNLKESFLRVFPFIVPLFFFLLVVSIVLLKSSLNKKNIILEKEISEKSKIENNLKNYQKELLKSNEELKTAQDNLTKKNNELTKTLEDFYTIRLSMQRDIEAGKIKEENDKIKKKINKLKKEKI